jgi:uncharacterized SAM-dependent methyltransferase
MTHFSIVPPGERRAFFQDLARGMEASDALLLGVDLVKDEHPAGGRLVRRGAVGA